MDYKKIKAILATNKEKLCKRYKIKNIGIFGSYVHGVQNIQSDIDVLVEFEESSKLSLLDLAGLEIELSDLLGIKVDLVEKRNLKPFIGKRVLKEVIYI
ncbi:MAG: nucleotidyltransferase family protein [Candidatus Ranarchaeia archaeon]